MKKLITKITKWVGTDGLLHFLVCYAMMLALTPIIGLTATLGITIILATIKELWDYCIQKDNNEEQVMHDVICDAVGIISALLTMAVWWMGN